MATFDLALPAGADLANPAEDLRAACLGYPDPELFFPNPSDDPTPAKKICAACPIRQTCLTWAIATRQSGIWGGELLERGKPDWANTKWRNPYPVGRAS